MKNIAQVNIINKSTDPIEVKVAWNSGKDQKTEKLLRNHLLNLDFKTWKIPASSKIEVTITNRPDLAIFEYSYDQDSKEIWDENIENFVPPPPPPPPPEEYGHRNNAGQLTILNNTPFDHRFYIQWNDGKDKKDFYAWPMTNTVIYPEQYDIRHNSKIDIYIAAPERAKHFSITYESGSRRSIIAEILMDGKLRFQER